LVSTGYFKSLYPGLLTKILKIRVIMMKTIVEDISSVKKKLIIEVGAEDVSKKVDRTFRQYGKKARIKGFRSGKIPRKVLENYYGPQVMDEVAGSIVNETLPKAIEETGMFPLNMPTIENDVLKPGENYKYTAVMEIRPEFELKDYNGLDVEKEVFSITEEDIDKHIEEIREARGNLVSIEGDRGIDKGDFAIIDYEGFDGNDPVEGIKSEDFTLKIGEGRFYPGFEEGMEGLKKGDETEIAVEFEDDYFHSGLAGKKVSFKVSIKDIKKMELPELNDEFVKDLGNEIKDLDDLKEKVKEGLTDREEKRVDNDLKERLLGKISSSVEFELPESLVEPELNSALNSIRQNLMNSGSDFEKAGLNIEKLKEELRPVSEKKVKGMLILGKIANENELNVEDKDIAEGFDSMAAGMGQSPNVLRQYYEANQQMMDSFRETLLREKTLNYLVENANVKEVSADQIHADNE
jgi:trigger factor